jgi:hypothetical protein
MKDGGMKASALRGMLIAALFMALIGASAGFYFTLNALTSMVNDIRTNSPALTSNDSIVKATSALKAFTLKNKVVGDKADTFIIASADAQSKIMSDIKKYATSTGISVSNFSFNKSNTAQASTGGDPIAELVTITLDNPVNFNGMMKFLILIENSLPKMQISGINISASDNTTVKVDPITIKYYVD